MQQVMAEGLLEGQRQERPQRQRALAELAELLHSPAPDVKKIKELRAEEQALLSQARRRSAELVDRVLNSLSDADYLTFLRTEEYPLPPRIVSIRTPSQEEGQQPER